MTDLAPGLRGTSSRVVTEDLTATKLGSGSVPVFGTPALLAMLEDAAVAAVAGALDAGMTTVGVWAELEHLAASKVGAHLNAEAELVAVSGRTLEFACTAHEGDKLIGRARHRRAIVDAERFLARA
jgi:predicted thioesterase